MYSSRQKYLNIKQFENIFISPGKRNEMTAKYMPRCQYMVLDSTKLLLGNKKNNYIISFCILQILSSQTNYNVLIIIKHYFYKISERMNIA